MADYKRILFAMDLSIESTLMFKRVKKLTELFDAKLTVVHVIEDVEKGSFEEKARIASAREFMQEILSPTLSNKNIVIESGNIQDVILKTARDRHSNLIVIGGEGKKRLSPMLGEKVTAILSILKCDVLTLCVSNYKKKKKSSS